MMFFEKWLRNLMAKTNTTQLCSGSFEKGPLQHPRAISASEQHLFIDKVGTFDGRSYQSTMMLYHMFGMFVEKISNLLYSTLTFRVNDNEMV